MGRQGEEAAARHLVGEGYTIKERNWRCPSGELDLIADDEGVTVFVEVRSRRDTGTFGSPEESVDMRKQRKVRETAAYYLYRSRATAGKSRIDVITILFTAEGQLLKLNHLKNAF
ncbi:YraN family protein [Paenibacillus ginsengarvi]|uniref:UPF0102 protein D7M11_00780 n=1 Tax=Paenibacillus ginsengarvi TaxID=400777 RepID=A0A3B0CQW8_9BACL|nr:YraN family protein [Paenibacillus ginsengarvi]